MTPSPDPDVTHRAAGWLNRLDQQLLGGPVSQRDQLLADFRRDQAPFGGILLDDGGGPQFEARFGEVSQEFGLLVEDADDADARGGGQDDKATARAPFPRMSPSADGIGSPCGSVSGRPRYSSMRSISMSLTACSMFSASSWTWSQVRFERPHEKQLDEPVPAQHPQGQSCGPPWSG